MTYSHDLRIKTLEYAEKCGSNLMPGLSITPRTVLNWMKLKKQGKLAPKKRCRRPTKIDSEKLKSYIQEHPDAYLREIAEAFGATC